MGEKEKLRSARFCEELCEWAGALIGAATRCARAQKSRIPTATMRNPCEPSKRAAPCVQVCAPVGKGTGRTDDRGHITQRRVGGFARRAPRVGETAARQRYGIMIRKKRVWRGEWSRA